MMNEHVLKDYFAQLHHLRHRGLIVLSGSRDWATALVHELIVRQTSALSVNALWLTDEDVKYDNVRQFKPRATTKYLGTECDVLVFDGYSGFSPNAFCAAADTVLGGGIVFLIIPDLSLWPDWVDVDFSHAYHTNQAPHRFVKRFIGHLLAISDSPGNHFFRLITPDSPPLYDLLLPHHLSIEVSTSLNMEQQQLIQAINKTLNGRAHRPLVISAARGRGKSAAVGMALAEWLITHPDSRVVLTGPGRDAVATLFRWAEAGVDSFIDHDQLQINGAALLYVPIDVVIREHPPANVLVIDEAAAIPLPILQRLLAHYSRIIFVTTTLGYEGSGRGFALRFSRILDAYSTQWRRAGLLSPIRWASDDPLEIWLRNCFLLADHDQSDSFGGIPAGKKPSEVAIQIHKIYRDELLLQEDNLSALFRLLVDAHYRTEPDDLRYLLDAPGVQIWGIFVEKIIVGAAIVVEEDALSEEMANRIKTELHRPRGYLLAQTLALQAGIYSSFSLSAWRVMRIAVCPEYQRQGLGRSLLAAIIAQARTEKIDYIGSSFAVDAEILRFWLSAGFAPLRMGLHRDHATASYSILVAHALTDNAHMMCNLARQRFADQLPMLLPTHWRDVEADLLAVIYSTLPQNASLSAIDYQQVNDYLRGAVAFEIAQCALTNMLQICLPEYLRKKIPEEQVRLPLRAIMQHWPWRELLQMETCSGRKALEIKLREDLRAIFLDYK